MHAEIRQIITDQINRHVAMTDEHRAWLAKDIADRVERAIRDNIRIAVDSECSCGGAAKGMLGCPACGVYHRLT